MEFKIGQRTRVAGIPISELQLKKDILIAGIIRDGDLIIPRGSDTIKYMDSVIIVSKGHFLSEVDDILEGFRI
jgi:trk system potassium uptake protein TrkA